MAKKNLINFDFFMDKGKNFIEQIIDEDLKKQPGFDMSLLEALQFRFPLTEPNGFLVNNPHRSCESNCSKF